MESEDKAKCRSLSDTCTISVLTESFDFVVLKRYSPQSVGIGQIALGALALFSEIFELFFL
jgi:hypothetical protein